MATIGATIWSEILERVRDTHGDLARAWFQDLPMPALEHGLLTIQTLNDAQAEYLDRCCRTAFTEATQSVTQRLVTVAFRLPEASSGHGANHAVSFNGQEQLLLNPDYTFDHFVTGPCNRLAHAAAISVAEHPGRSYNPFFVHGPVGLGKTHLLQAVCHAAKRREGAKVLYISCETFINHFIEAVERGALHQFRYLYRYVDVLVIDDIQFLAERERSQEEFFHNFNTLHQAQKQIVLSADCPPAEIPSLEERLVSRFSSGLVALVDRPCLETRMGIVRKKAKLRGVEVPEPVVHFIAGRAEQNIRELEGALLKVDALSQTLGIPITLELANEALGSRAPAMPVAIPAILEAVARKYQVKVSDLQSKKRAQVVTFPRHVCMYLARRLTKNSLETIGGYFGGRDHSTVLHATRAVGRGLENDAQLRETVEQLSRELRNGRV